MNKTINLFKISLANLERNKGRTFLSVLGITIGITTVLMIFSTGAAIKRFLISQAETFGANYVEVEVKVPSVAQVSTENAMGMAQGVTITTLTLGDAEAIGQLDNVDKFYAGVLDQKIISYEDFNDNTFIFGVGAEYINIDPGELMMGRFYSEEEDRSLSQVVVLGSTTAKNIFSDDDPIGKKVRVHKSKYEVIGVMEERGASLGFNLDDMIFIPVRTVQKKLMGIDYISFIFANMVDNSQSALTVVEIEEIMRDRHNAFDPSQEDFAVTSSDQALDILGGVTDATAILLLLIASISLIVGSVGIMNIMFVTVTERTSEIGLRKAVGATPKDIQLLFLIESMVITFVGGILGVIFGVILTVLVSVVAQSQGFDWPAIFEIHFFVISVGVAILVGLVAGYIPARRAAQLDPIAALRK